MARGSSSLALLALVLCAAVAAVRAGAFAPPEGAPAGQATYQGYAIGVADGFQEVPSVTTPAWGRALIAVYSTGDAYFGLVWARLAKKPATAVVASHLHGPHAVLNRRVSLTPNCNQSAGIRIPLPAQTELTEYRVDINADQYAAITKNSFYYNLHTSAYPNGEIRANLICGAAAI